MPLVVSCRFLVEILFYILKECTKLDGQYGHVGFKNFDPSIRAVCGASGVFHRHRGPPEAYVVGHLTAVPVLLLLVIHETIGLLYLPSLSLPSLSDRPLRAPLLAPPMDAATSLAAREVVRMPPPEASVRCLPIAAPVAPACSGLEREHGWSLSSSPHLIHKFETLLPCAMPPSIGSLPAFDHM
jgi:hypothetical protein